MTDSSSQANTSPSTSSKLKRPGTSVDGISTTKKARNNPPAREYYASSGIKANFHGDLYQVKLLMLYLIRGFKAKYEFKLATEMNAAEKFDDLVFAYLDTTGKKKYKFLQAKHKQDESRSRISITHLKSTNDSEMFSLQKYFSSYIKILSKPDFKDGDVENFTIATNINIDDNVRRLMEKVNLQDTMFTHGINKNTKCYKFKPSKERDSIACVLKNASELQRLAAELAEYVTKNKKIDLRNTLFKTYQEILANKIIDVQKKTFRQQFVNGDSTTDTWKFYQMFAKYFKSKGGNLAQIKQQKLIVANTFGDITSSNYQTFPNDDVTDKEIDGFFEKLVLAVNLPNEEELSGILMKDLEDQFQFDDIKLTDVSMVAKYFQVFVIDWVKEKQAYLLSQHDVENLISEIKLKLALQLSVLPTSLHRKDLTKIGANFAGDNTSVVLNNFLTSPNDRMLHLNAATTVLGAIRVNEALKRDNTYKNVDTHIFTTLRNIVHAKPFLTALKTTTINLLVIECTDGIDDLSILYLKLYKIMNRAKKKIILITTQVRTLSECWNQFRPINFNDNSCFQNLTTESQEKLLRERQVHFLGHKISFSEIIDKPLRRELERNFENELLLPLLNKEKIVIGDPLSSLDDDKDIYIRRTLQRRLQISKNFLKNSASSNIFALSNITKSTISEMNNEQNVQSLSDDLTNNVSSRFIVINDDVNDFDKLCDICKDLGYSIHWLRWVEEDDCFVWQQSQGTLSVFRKFIATRKVASYMPERITDISERFVLIAAEPGMGKTTVLTRLATKSSESAPSKWIIRINLLEHSKELKETTLNSSDVECAFKFLLTIANMNTSLSKYLFKNSCHCGQNVIILFDGFDEISPDHKEKVILLVTMLKSSRIAKIWLTTRSHLKHELEDRLSVFSYSLLSFTLPDQKKFLTLFWKKNVGYDKAQSRLDYCLDVFSEKLLELTYQSIPDKERELTGIPLQTKMLAEAFLRDVKNFVTSDLELPTLPIRLDILDLYDRFVWSKYILYSETKAKIPSDTNPIASRNRKRYYGDTFLPDHNLLALGAIFNAEERNTFLAGNHKNKLLELMEDVKEGKEKSGIILQNIDDNLLFVHRTFAEYFCARFFTSNEEFQKSKVKNFLREFVFHEGSGVIRHFFDRMLAKSEESRYPEEPEERDDKFDLQQASMNNDVGKVRELLAHKPQCINTTDEGGRTALHLSATCGHTKIAEMLLDNDEIIVSLEDDVFSWSPITYAAKSGHWDIVNMLLEKGARAQDIIIAKDVSTVYEGSKTLLHIASEEGYVKLVNELVSTLNADWEARDENRMIPLHVGAFHNRLEVVTILKEKGGLDSVDESNRTPLKVAINGGSMEVVRFLGEQEANLDALLLHTAVNNGDLDLVKSVIKDECLDTILGDFTPLHSAAYRANYLVVEYLVNRGADVNLSGTIVSAGGKDNVATVQLLIKLGASIHMGNEDGFTPIHAAARNGAINTLKYLVETKELHIDVNVRDKKGTTPLQSAAFHNRLDVAEYLIRTGNVEIDASDYFGATPIFSAALQNNHEMVKLLFRNGARIEQTDGFLGALRFSVLHVAAAFDAVEVLQMLVEEGGANVNAGEGVSLTPLHVAALFNSTKVIEYLVTKNANVEALIEFFNVSTVLGTIDTSQVHNMDKLIPYLRGFVSTTLKVLGCCKFVIKFTPRNISVLFNFNNELLELKTRPAVSLVNYLPNFLCQKFQTFINKLRALVEHIKGNQRLPRNVVGDILVEYGLSKTHYVAS